MKIVCESCGAKYSIADERVSGKVFKIRCKKCSEVIVVRGDQAAPAAAAPAPAAEPVAQDGIWHVVVEGEQAGPYTPAQLGELLSAGTIDWEAYVWTEGFDNWVPMRDVEDLVAQVTGQAPAPPMQAARPIATSTLVGQPSMGADPFADDAAPSGGMFGDAPPSASGDLFGRGHAAASPFGGGDDDGVVASSPSPRVSSDKLMTGARNENSVLFSLKNLQALATGSTGTSLPPSSSGMPERSAGFASGEGSGLIDIRALASATGVAEAGGGGAKDELLSLGSQGGAFGALGSPMLAPVSSDDDGGKKTIIWASVAGVGFLSVAAVAVAYLMRTPPPAPAAAVGMATAATAQAAAVPPPAPAPVAPAPSEGEQAAKAAEDKEGSGERSSSSSSGSRRKRASSSDEGAKSGDAPAGETRSAPEPEAPKAPSGPRTIDDLLDGALKGGSSRPKPTEAERPSNLPDQPSRADVISAMTGVKGDVAACGKGQGGVATVKVSVAGATGRVTNAQVSGVTGPAGSCVAQAVRKASFPKFQQKVFSVTFPFKL